MTTEPQGRMRRRDFLKTSALLGGGTLAAGALPWSLNVLNGNPAREIVPDSEYILARPENVIYSVCQQCNTQCGIKVKIRDGAVAKIEGSPYSPWGMNPHVPFASSPFEMATVDASICPKGHSAIQTSYDPYRTIKVLKRAGPRGSKQWQSIPFDKAISEIVEGGKLFAHVPGEEGRIVAGLKEIRALTDAALAQKMADDVKAIVAEKDKEKKKALVEKFKKDHAANLDKLIDPEHPDLGPKNNQLVFNWGRLKGGRSEFISRFVKDAFGSTNAHGHTTVCQGSLYFSGKAMSEQFTEGSWTGGKKLYWQADQESVEFILFVGVNPFEASQGPTLRAKRVTSGLSTGRLRYAVVDPRLSRTASKAWKWLPNVPGTEAAIALAVTRWIIDNKRHDAKFLANANKAAATADKEPSWSNAAWLVKLDDKGQPGKFLRGSDLGLAKEKRTNKAGKEWDFDPFVVWKGDAPVTLDPNDEKTAVEGDLFVDGTVNGHRVKSSMQLLKEEAARKTIEQWCEMAGVRAADVEEIADELTSHGKRAAVDIHRGVSQHTNGMYAASAWFNVNLLIGNYDWKGGMVGGSTWDQTGEKDGQPYPLSKMHPGKMPVFGLSSIRHDAKYEDSTIFSGYPAKRPWYPLSSDVYQEVIPSIAEGYPYPAKVLILYMGSPAYALPAGNIIIDALADPNKIPLVIASDIGVGETSMYADYIFPDAANLERWEFAGTQFSVLWKVQPVRQPAIPAPNEVVTVFGERMPISLEAMLLAFAEKLGLPGYGAKGFGTYGDFTRPEDLYLKEVANVAAGQKADSSEAVPDADEKEVALFSDSRRHMAAEVFLLERWQQAVKPELWKKVVYILNRGGRFDDYDKAYDGERLKNKYAAQINMYQEKTATTKDSMTGMYYSGMPGFTPAAIDLLGRPIVDDGFDMRLITHKEITETKSRTAGNYWLGGINPDGVFTINRVDAERLNLKHGDKVKVVSATNPEGIWDFRNGERKPMIGKIQVIEGIRPGVVSFSLGKGHWSNGATDLTIDGVRIKGDERRARGLHANAAMRTDPAVPTLCLTDPLGGSAVFYDTTVRLVKV